jgi:hypothetical protein
MVRIRRLFRLPFVPLAVSSTTGRPHTGFRPDAGRGPRPGRELFVNIRYQVTLQGSAAAPWPRIRAIVVIVVVVVAALVAQPDLGAAALAALGR